MSDNLIENRVYKNTLNKRQVMRVSVLPVGLRDNNKGDIMGFCNNKNL